VSKLTVAALTHSTQTDPVQSQREVIAQLKSFPESTPSGDLSRRTLRIADPLSTAATPVITAL